MRKCILLILVLSLMCLPLTAFAEETEGMCGQNITWRLEGSTLTISGAGAMYDFTDGAPWDAYKSTITTVIFTGGVTYVGAASFKDFDSLTSVSFGDAMYELGSEAFRDCDGLTSLSMPASFKVFGAYSLASCGSLKTLNCAGRFPTFRNNCLWDTYLTLVYPTVGWPVDTIAEMEQAFHGRIEFRCADGTDPIKPTEPEPTTQPTTEPTTAPTTQPDTTPVTFPTFTVPGSTPPPYTNPPSVPASTGQQEKQSEGNTTLWLVLLLVVAVSAAAAAVIIHTRQVQKRRRRARRRRRPDIS